MDSAIKSKFGEKYGFYFTDQEEAYHLIIRCYMCNTKTLKKRINSFLQ